MFIFETETKCQLWGGGQREREGDTESEAAPGSELSTHSPMQGSNFKP